MPAPLLPLAMAPPMWHVAHQMPQDLRLLGAWDDTCIRLPPTPLHPQAIVVARAAELLAVRLAGGGGSELLTIAPCQVSAAVAVHSMPTSTACSRRVIRSCMGSRAQSAV